MKNYRILVTGIHRSGTTFVGKMLSLNRSVAYLQEPFNRYYGLNTIDARFKYLTERTIDRSYQQMLDDLLNLKRAIYNITSVTEKRQVIVSRRELLQEMFEEVNASNLSKFIGKFLFRTEGQLRFEWAKYNPFTQRLLLKDPEACFASQFLHRNYGTAVVMIIRHPLSFAASLKRVGWRFDFRNFLDQPQLMADYLETYRQEMQQLNEKSTVVEEAGLLWNCIYKVAADFIDGNPAMVVVKHRDLAKQPVDTFKHLYNLLELQYTPAVERKIMTHTSPKNPTMANRNHVHQLKRNSAEIPDNWKRILTDEEVAYIREKTGKIANLFYRQ